LYIKTIQLEKMPGKSRPAFSRRLPSVAAHLDIGAASRKLSEVAVLSVCEEAGRTRSRLLEEKDRRPVRALAASSMLRRRDPVKRVRRRRAGSPFRSPAHPGLRQRRAQSPGGWPAGKAVWPRLIITPGKLRGAM